jgi:hypothetical protein
MRIATFTKLLLLAIRFPRSRSRHKSLRKAAVTPILSRGGSLQRKLPTVLKYGPAEEKSGEGFATRSRVP